MSFPFKKKQAFAQFFSQACYVSYQKLNILKIPCTQQLLLLWQINLDKQPAKADCKLTTNCTIIHNLVPLFFRLPANPLIYFPYEPKEQILFFPQKA